MKEFLQTFFELDSGNHGPIYNERSLQLELGLFLRSQGYSVEFERPFDVSGIDGTTRKSKRYLDLLVNSKGHTIGIELKVPLSGRVPETMYDFCADIAFIESILRSGNIQRGFCILITSDALYWKQGGADASIYSYFRQPGVCLTGPVDKPTGTKDTRIIVEGNYELSSAWFDCRNTRLMNSGRCLVVEIGSESKKL